METETTYCKNCDAVIDGPFCKNCGQRTKVYKVSFRDTFDDLAASLFSIEAPLWKTIKLLFIKPGLILRDYLAGRRKRYYKPVTFFILTTFVYLLLRNLIGFDPFNDSTIVAEDSSASQLLTKARNFMLLNIDKLLFVFVFTLALWLKLFFYRKRSFAEFIAISFYLLGVYTILVTMNMFYIQYFGEMQFLGMLAMGVYFIYAMVSFFDRRLFLVAIKSVFVYLFAVLSYMIVAFGISYLIVAFL